MNHEQTLIDSCVEYLHRRGYDEADADSVFTEPKFGRVFATRLNSVLVLSNASGGDARGTAAVGLLRRVHDTARLVASRMEHDLRGRRKFRIIEAGVSHIRSTYNHCDWLEVFGDPTYMRLFGFFLTRQRVLAHTDGCEDDVEKIDDHLWELEQEWKRRTQAHEALLSRLKALPGVKRTVARQATKENHAPERAQGRPVVAKPGKPAAKPIKQKGFGF